MRYNRKMTNHYNDNYEDTYDDEYDDSPITGAPLAEPIQKGGRVVQSFSYALCRNLSLILILSITGIMIYDFLRGSTPYGDYIDAFSSQIFPQKLVAYFVVAAFFILFELLSACWAMTRQRVYYNDGIVKEDVGRGKFSFIFIYICSYISFLTNKFLPDSIDILAGIKGALDVFGAMHNLLFWFCLTGVISCIIRKRFLN